MNQICKGSDGGVEPEPHPAHEPVGDAGAALAVIAAMTAVGRAEGTSKYVWH